MGSGQTGGSFFGVIVILVVIGLSVGGWLVFSHLQKTAKVNTIIAELGQFTKATHTFLDVYEYLPGDMPNATTFWVNDMDCPGPKCCTGIAWSAGECNGNGNHQIRWSAAKESNESLRAWQHLGLSGFLESSYDGIGRGIGEALPGENVPASSEEGIGYDFHYAPVGPVKERNYIGVGAYNSGGALNAAALTASEAYNIDKKIDDGYPLQGKFLSSNGANVEGCLRGFVAASSTYNSTKSSIACISHMSIDKETSR